MRDRDPFAALGGGVLPRMRVNHKATYFAFKEEHGEPEDDGERLLFRDGWTRSNRSHKARPVPPPADRVALAAIQRRFWQLRAAEAARQIKELRRALAAHAELSGPVVVDVEEVDATRRGWEFFWQPAQFDPAALTERLDLLEEALDQCRAELRALAGVDDATCNDPDSITNPLRSEP